MSILFKAIGRGVIRTFQEITFNLKFDDFGLGRAIGRTIIDATHKAEY